MAEGLMLLRERLEHDDGLVNEMMHQATTQDVQRLLAGKGIDLCLFEINAMFKIFATETRDELSDGALDQVVGGATHHPAMLQVVSIIISTLGGHSKEVSIPRFD